MADLIIRPEGSEDPTEYILRLNQSGNVTVDGLIGGQSYQAGVVAWDDEMFTPLEPVGPSVVISNTSDSLHQISIQTSNPDELVDIDINGQTYQLSENLVTGVAGAIWLVDPELETTELNGVVTLRVVTLGVALVEDTGSPVATVVSAVDGTPVLLPYDVPSDAWGQTASLSVTINGVTTTAPDLTIPSGVVNLLSSPRDFSDVAWVKEASVIISDEGYTAPNRPDFRMQVLSHDTVVAGVLRQEFMVDPTLDLYYRIIVARGSNRYLSCRSGAHGAGFARIDVDLLSGTVAANVVNAALMDEFTITELTTELGTDHYEITWVRRAADGDGVTDLANVTMNMPNAGGGSVESIGNIYIAEFHIAQNGQTTNYTFT